MGLGSEVLPHISPSAMIIVQQRLTPRPVLVSLNNPAGVNFPGRMLVALTGHKTAAATCHHYVC